MNDAIKAMKQPFLKLSHLPSVVNIFQRATVPLCNEISLSLCRLLSLTLTHIFHEYQLLVYEINHVMFTYDGENQFPFTLLERQFLKINFRFLLALLSHKQRKKYARHEVNV